MYDNCCGHIVFEIIDYEGLAEFLSCERLDCPISAIQQFLHVRDVLTFETEGAHDAMSLFAAAVPTVTLVKWLKGIELAPSKLVRVFASQDDLCERLKEELPSLNFAVPSFARGLVRLIRIHIETFLLITKDEYRKRLRDSIYSLTKSRLSETTEDSDCKIIQAVALLDSLNSEQHKQVERIKDVFGQYFPGLGDILSDEIDYCKFISLARNKFNIVQHAPMLISAFGVDKEKRLRECAEIGLISPWPANDPTIRSTIELADQVVETCDYRCQLNDFVREQMTKVAPNLTHLVGEDVGSRLLSKFGSVSAISRLSSSEIQLAGAQRSLNIAKSTNTPTPKYGFIFYCPIMMRADQRVKGKLARTLASKVALAARIDSLSENPEPTMGLKYLQELEKKFIHRSLPHKIHRLNEVVDAAKLYALNESDRMTLKSMNIEFEDCGPYVQPCCSGRKPKWVKRM